MKMPSNDVKIDQNCINSFKRAKKDVYSLMNAKEEQKLLLTKILAMQEENSQKMNEFNVLVANFNNESDNALAQENAQRITDLWEYTESVKARTTRLNTSMKKLRIEMIKLIKISSTKSKEVRKKITTLSTKISKKQSEIDKLSASQKKLNKNVQKSKVIVNKLNVKKPRKVGKFGSLNPDLNAVEGISEKHILKLKAAGINTTMDLLMQGNTQSSRKALSKQIKVNKKKILEWINRVDLMRISGIGEEYSDLLEEAGVDTVPELALRNPENLTESLPKINEKKKLVKSLPSFTMVKDWIKQAKRLPRIIEY